MTLCKKGSSRPEADSHDEPRRLNMVTKVRTQRAAKRVAF